MASVIPFQEHEAEDFWEHQLRYHVYSYKGVTPDGYAFVRSFIVIRDGYRIIRRFTRLHEYAGIYEKAVYIPVSSNPEAKLHYICAMLNYVITDHGEELQADSVLDITKPMLEQFFYWYAQTPKHDGGHKGKETVERCIYAVTRFMYKLWKLYSRSMKIMAPELYHDEYYYTNRGEKKRRRVPSFKVRGIQDVHYTFRDLPTKAVELLVPLAFRHARDIAFAICLQLFAGLRAGEAMSVRQEASPLGSGIQFTFSEGRIIKAEIDLTKDYVLRSDRIETGKIKKKRKQCVYPPFLQAFYQAYGYHCQYMTSCHYEEEYKPMFVNRDGMAMSYESYSEKFRALIQERLCPVLLESRDPKMHLYGQLIYENGLQTHACRHWFSVQLVLHGEDIAGIQYWRGDSSPESAFAYLQSKGDLSQELAAANDRLAGILQEAGEWLP